MTPKLSVVVVSWNTREVLRECLASLGAHLAPDHEAIVVDNASADASAEMVERDFPQARVVRNPVNLGYGAGCNVGMREARGEYVLLLNSDARLRDAGIGRLVERMDALPRVGIAGPRLVLPDGRLQASARRFPSLGRLLLSELFLYRLLPRARAAERLLGPFWDHEKEREADWLVGACLLVRRAVFVETGGFDPGMFLYGEEVEWCRRVRAAGWSVLFSPVCEVLHLDHQSADILLGSRGRVDRCLVAEDQLVGRWQGAPAGLLAGVVRVGGALLRIAAFRLRGLLLDDDEYGRAVREGARAVLGHYLRRLTGRLESEPR